MHGLLVRGTEAGTIGVTRDALSTAAMLTWSVVTKVNLVAH